jgi:hypothetical protein
VLLATSACYLVYYTGRQNLGWAIPGLRAELGLTATEIGWISGAGLVLYGVGQLVSGHVADRAGGRRLVALGTETVDLALDPPTWSGGAAVIGALGSATLNITDNESTVQFGAAKFTSLDHLAKLCGLPGKMDVKGADVAALYDEGCYGTIDRYCLEDVYQTALIYIRWLHLRGELSIASTNARMTDIFNAISEEKHPAFKAALVAGGMK